jgi:hypothetical protein
MTMAIILGSHMAQKGEYPSRLPKVWPPMSKAQYNTAIRSPKPTPTV